LLLLIERLKYDELIFSYIVKNVSGGLEDERTY